VGRTALTRKGGESLKREGPDFLKGGHKKENQGKGKTGKGEKNY